MDLYQYNQYSSAQKQAILDKEKENELKNRISAFENVKTLEEAKELAKKIIPTAQECTSFYVGKAKCFIVNKHNLVRISIDTDTEFICYDFS